MYAMMNFSRLWFLNVAGWLLGVSLLFGHSVGQMHPKSFVVEFVNDLFPVHSMEVFWLNYDTDPKLISQAKVTKSFALTTFVSHRFLIVPDDAENVDLSSYSHAIRHPNVTELTIEEYDKTLTISRGNNGTLNATKVNSFSHFRERLKKSISECVAKEQGISEDRSCSSNVDQPVTLNPDLLDCISRNGNLLGHLLISQSYSPPVYNRDIALEQTKQASVLKRVTELFDSTADHLRNYTCADPMIMTPTIDDPRTLRVKKWRDHDVQVFLEDEDASVMLLHDFVPEEACNILVSESMENLERAQVVKPGGGSEYSTYRRALTHTVLTNLSDANDPLAILFKKAYDFANDETGYNLNVDSTLQEAYQVISYEYGDEYLTHCDGGCDGSDYRPGGRVSTMVLYCSEAELGGGTSFPNIGVNVKGHRGQAAFFSYLGPDMKMDIGKTRHSGCPVLKGRKWIATLWMRKGLSVGNGYDKYDPTGNPHPQ